jgi:hypothetical protein
MEVTTLQENIFREIKFQAHLVQIFVRLPSATVDFRAGSRYDLQCDFFFAAGERST